MATSTSPTWFSAKLAHALATRDLSVRKTAQLWRPGKPESGRRSLIRYMQGQVIPEPETCREIADAIGAKHEELLPDEEEEAHMTLSQALDRMFARRIEKALDERLQMLGIEVTR